MIMLQYNIINENISKKLEIIGVCLVDINQCFQINFQKKINIDYIIIFYHTLFYSFILFI